MNGLAMTKAQQKRLSQLMKNDIGSLIATPNLSGLTIGLDYRVWVTCPYMPAPKSMDEFLDRMEQTQRAKAAMHEALSMKRVEKLFNREQLFRFSYVPFVIAELVWDYADTVLYCAQQLGNPITRKLSRVIRNARAEFERECRPYVDDESLERQLDNGYMFEDGVKYITDQMLANIKIDIQCEYPELEGASRDLLISVYQCHILSKALLLYMSRQNAQVEKKIGGKVGDILPKSYYVMDKLVPEFVGDKPLSERFKKLMYSYISTYATQIGLIELSDTPEPEIK